MFSAVFWFIGAVLATVFLVTVGVFVLVFALAFAVPVVDDLMKRYRG